MNRFLQILLSVWTFAAVAAHELSPMVAGAVSRSVSGVTVKDNANPAVGVAVYADESYARANVTALDGANTFTAVATDSGGLKDTNTVSVNLPNTVNFTYDANGNLTGDGRRVLFYDDENQLTRVTVATVSSSGFVYDGFGRMRIRYESNWIGSAWSKVAEVRYVYDGKLPIQERDANNNVLVTYTRGRDLSGTLEGAGGIGGLLARSQLNHPTAPHAYYHADGSGNITALINQNQQVVARYNYSPFGSIINQSGYLADANAYRFSSKEYHAPSGLSYYLHRFYDPSLQRWVNEDPIGEAGGINLYGFVKSSPVNRIDPFGLACETPWDVFNVGLGLLALKGNVAEGRMLAAFVDAGGLLLDSGLTAVPIAPAFAGSTIKAARKTDKLSDFLKLPPSSKVVNILGAGGGGGTSKMGRAGKQSKLRELATDPNASSVDRGWIRQEMNSIDRGQRKNIRVPPGKNLAHRRGFEAKKGCGYEHSDLQNIDLHKLQHKHEGY